MSRSDLPEPLASAWQSLSGSASLQDARQALIAAGLGTATSPELRLREYAVRFDFTDRIQPYVDLLDRLAALELAAAPVVLATHKHSPEMGVITWYASVPGEDLLPVRGSTEPVPPHARDRLRAEVMRLYQAGYEHPFAHRGYTHWRRSSTTHTLVLDSWEALRTAPSESERAQNLQDLDHWLGRLP